MKKFSISLLSSLFVISTLAFAEEAELLDIYLEDLPSSGSQHKNVEIVGQPVEVVVDENGVSREVVQPEMVKYRRIESANGAEVYEVVPLETDTSAVTNTNNVVNNDVQSTEDMQVIELEPTQEEFVVIEAPENQSGQQVVTTKSTTDGTIISGNAFCQQNPHARECTLSKYLSLCEKDPQSTDCKSQLQKFDNFCATFPNAYKCKKAKIIAACQKNPTANSCKTFSQRYCQKYPKAVFCDYN